MTAVAKAKPPSNPPPPHKQDVECGPALTTNRTNPTSTPLLSTHQQEVNTAQHRVIHVVGASLILKLNMQAVLNAHLHLLVCVLRRG